MSTEPDYKSPPDGAVGERQETRDSGFSTEEAELVAACFKPAWEIEPQAVPAPPVPSAAAVGSSTSTPSVEPVPAPKAFKSTLVWSGDGPSPAPRHDSSAAGPVRPLSPSHADSVLQTHAETSDRAAQALPPPPAIPAGLGALGAVVHEPALSSVDPALRFDAVADNRASPDATRKWTGDVPRAAAPIPVAVAIPPSSSRVSDPTLQVPMRGLSRTGLAVVGILGALAIVATIGGIRIMKSRAATLPPPSVNPPRLEQTATATSERVLANASETAPPPIPSATVAAIETPSATSPQPTTATPGEVKQPTRATAAVAAPVTTTPRSTTPASKPTAQKSGSGIVRDTPF